MVEYKIIKYGMQINHGMPGERLKLFNKIS
jgi:hypothetical protein